MSGLQGKVAMVTGCAGERGIGRAIARRLAQDGADLVLTDIGATSASSLATKPPTGWRGLDAVAEEIQSMGRHAIAARLDVRSANQIDAVITQALMAFGRLDILVNNAASPPGADRVPVVELSEEAWDAVLDVNLKGTFLCARAAANVMLRLRVRGRIINLASDRAKIGTANLAAYCASKFGIVGFTQALSRELAPTGITVNAICPGGVDSERLDYHGRCEDGSYDEDKRKERIRQLSAEVPLGRMTKPEDVAEVAAFLASEPAEYITGQSINVTGGTVMH